MVDTEDKVEVPVRHSDEDIEEDKRGHEVDKVSANYNLTHNETISGIKLNGSLMKKHDSQA